MDSGILYRRLAYEIIKKNVKISEINNIKNILKNIKTLSLRKTKVLRMEKIGKTASEIAKLDFVRQFINAQQKLATTRPNKKKRICN